MLWPFLLALAIHLASGVFALLSWRDDRQALAETTAGCVLASLLGGAAAIRLLTVGGTAALGLPGRLPLGEFAIGIDALSAFFLLCIYGVSALSAVYGAGYLAAGRHDRPLAPLLFFFTVLVASMSAVALARDGVLFLMAWELMSLSGFFLVTFEHHREEVRRAGMVYLVASQLGVVCLFALFALLAGRAGDFRFASMALSNGLPAAVSNAVFLLALLGFGSKAGFWFLHIWLPEAHPAAPSHVSAIMSGIMIKMGIYGLLRVLTFLAAPPPWWGITLIVIGGVSGVLGVLHALCQHELKRLLAYHSVENVGIITLGIGLGLLGESMASPSMAFLGYCGALLHTLNHGLFKGLLFQGAGAVLQATGSRRLDDLGGLARTMPVTAACFLIASMAICGLPPLNGFVSEFMIYVAAFRGGALHGAGVVAALAVIPTLALIGGLAAACFVKAYGIVFLGEPRSVLPREPRDPSRAMTVPMLLGALACLAIGLFPHETFRLVSAPARTLCSSSPLAEAMPALLVPLARVGLLLAALAAVLLLLRFRLLRGRVQSLQPTWGCGYPEPTPRMQYTASSFAEPVLGPFETLLARRVHESPPRGYFPERAHHSRHLGDLADERLIMPLTRRFLGLLHRLRVLQSGRVQLYLVYMLVTVVLALTWQLGGGKP